MINLPLRLRLPREEDSKAIFAADVAMVGQNQVVPTSGVVQYQTISGGIDRNTLWDAMKVMPSTPSNLEVHTAFPMNLGSENMYMMRERFSNR